MLYRQKPLSSLRRPPVLQANPRFQIQVGLPLQAGDFAQEVCGLAFEGCMNGIIDC